MVSSKLSVVKQCNTELWVCMLSKSGIWGLFYAYYVQPAVPLVSGVMAWHGAKDGHLCCFHWHTGTLAHSSATFAQFHSFFPLWPLWPVATDWLNWIGASQWFHWQRRRGWVASYLRYVCWPALYSSTEQPTIQRACQWASWQASARPSLPSGNEFKWEGDNLGRIATDWSCNFNLDLQLIETKPEVV